MLRARQTVGQLHIYYALFVANYTVSGIESLRHFVSDDQYERICNFMYLKSQVEVDEFDAWIKSLNIKELNDWWTHKVINKWILPSLIQCLSKISAADWAVTQSSSNIGETILTAQKLDNQTADEIQNSLKTDVLRNNRNDVYSRMSRNVICANTLYRKAHETKAHTNAIKNLDDKIQTLTQERKDNHEKLKAAKAQKAQISGRRSQA
ncbi:hypothetical protein H0H92_013017, partial [Tricholoma furcatifolium]